MMKKTVFLLVFAGALAIGCAERGPAKVVLGKSGWDLVALDKEERVLWRVPVAGVVKSVLEMRGPGDEEGQYYVAATGREHVRGGADVGAILLFDATGKRVWGTHVPQVGPYPAKQLNATSDGMCAVWRVDGQDLYLHCSTGGLYPRLVSVYALARGQDGQVGLKQRLSYWHCGHITEFRVIRDRTMYMAGLNNSIERYAENSYGMSLLRLDVPAPGAANLEGVGPIFGSGRERPGHGAYFYIGLRPLRDSKTTNEEGPAKPWGESKGLRWEDDRLAWTIRPPGLSSLVTLWFDADGRILEVRPEQGLEGEYGSVRRPDEPAFTSWLEGIRKAAAEGRHSSK